jgi:WD40 repeat protein
VQAPLPTKGTPNQTASQGLSIDIAAFSPDGKTLVTAGWSGSRQNGELHLWDVQTRKLRQTIRGFACGRFGVPSVAFSPDGKHLMWAAARTVKVWDTTTGQMMRTLRGHEDEVMAVAFGPDSRTVASASGTSSSSIGQYRIRLWDLQTGGVLRTISRPSEARCLAFSPDGFTLASGHTDAALRLWRLK